MMTHPIPAVTLALALVFCPLATEAAGGDDFSTLYHQALELRNTGDFRAAEARLEKALRLRPDAVDALYLLGMVQGFQKRYDEALVTLDKAASLDSDNLDVALGRARILGWSRRFGEAVEAVNAVLARVPDNVEAVNLQGRLAYYQDHLDAAEAAFRRALMMEPDNLEALLGLGDVLAVQGRYDNARELFARAAELHPDSLEPGKRLERLAKAPLAGETTREDEPQSPAIDRPWRIDTGYSLSDFTRRDRKRWHEGFAQITHSLTPTTRIFVGGRESHRGGLEDTQGFAGIGHRFQPWLSGNAQLTLTPAADFLPRWDAQVGAALRPLRGEAWIGDTWLTLDLRQRHYKTGNIRDIHPSIQQYLLNGRVWLTGRWLHVHDMKADKHMKGWLGRVDVQALEWAGVYLSRSMSPETDDGTAVDTHTTAGGLSVDVTPAVSLRVDYAQEQRKASFIRHEVSVGFAVKF